MQALAHIAVSGQIGAGKSTLVRGLAGALAGIALVERFEDNPYFDRFYADPGSWALRHFMFFFEQSVADTVQARASDRLAIQERVTEEHVEVFGREFHARGYIGDDDLAMIMRLTASFQALTVPPDLLIHVDVPVEEALSRLRGRGNAAEAAIDAEYLASLQARFEDFVENWRGPTIMRLSADRYDFRRPEDVEAVAHMVQEQLNGAGRHSNPPARSARHG